MFEEILLQKRKGESKLKPFHRVVFALEQEGYSKARICEILAENFPESEEYFTMTRLASFMSNTKNKIQLTKKEAAEEISVLEFDADRKSVERRNEPVLKRYHDEIFNLIEQGYSRTIIAEYISKKYELECTGIQINSYVYACKKYEQEKKSKKNSSEKNSRSPNVRYKIYHEEIFELVETGFSANDILGSLQERHPEEKNFTLANLRAYIKREQAKEQPLHKTQTDNVQTENVGQNGNHGKAGIDSPQQRNNKQDDSSSTSSGVFSGLSQPTDKV